MLITSLITYYKFKGKFLQNLQPKKIALKSVYFFIFLKKFKKWTEVYTKVYISVHFLLI